ncbi:acyl-CoA-binding domain protein, partial [Trifolium medium]|nr:acyl-CoA-binding domain protein [Trifolium medium]
RYIDIKTCQFGVIKTSGSVPVARVGQSATLVGSRVILFGGEDRSRKLLNDVHVLDLESMTWDMIKTSQTPPAPRYDHAAAMHGERPPITQVYTWKKMDCRESRHACNFLCCDSIIRGI